MKFPENPVSQTQYIPLRLCKRPHQPKPTFDACPIDLLTPVPESEPPVRCTETKEQQQEDHDNVPDTVSNTESSPEDNSGTLDSSPDSSSTTETEETILPASNEISGSTSMSKDSTETSESDSAPSTPLSPRQSSTQCTEEAMTPVLVPSRPPSPVPANNSLEVRQFYKDQTGHVLTHQEFKKFDNQAKQRATVLKQGAQLECNAKTTARRVPTGTFGGIKWCQSLCKRQAERQYSIIQ